MIYRNLGNSGLKVSVISVGNMFNYKQETKEEDKKIIQACLDRGINFFDTAQLYAKGQAESRLGQILKDLNVQRESIIVSTKVWVAPQTDINSNKTLNRKHVHESVDKSLQRLQLQYVDIVFAHGYDEQTPLEQVCRAFNQIIEEDKAFYWGTSNWKAESVYEAFWICEKLNLHKPICAQNQYHMLKRQQNEFEYQSLFQKYKFGLMGWSSLCGGFLTGKYLNGNDQKQLTRLTDEYQTPKQDLLNLYYVPYAQEQTKTKLQKLQKLAKEELNCSLPQLALAWCIKFQHLSTAQIGVRNTEQLEQNLKALEVSHLFNHEVQQKIGQILKNKPKQNVKFSSKQHSPQASRPLSMD